MVDHHPSTPGRFAAFISYRHRWLDRWWAWSLHRRLERYRTPRPAVARGIRRRIGRLFRDQEELAASASLTQKIRDALDRSDTLIVVCTPNTPASDWVDAEVEYFASRGRQNDILALLVKGTPETSFPRSFARLGIEPLAPDVRPGLLVWPPRKYKARLRLAARLLGCDFDDLYERDLRRRRVRQAIAAVLVVAAGWYAQGRIAASVGELARYSEQAAAEDSSLSMLLSRQAFETSHRWLGIGGDTARSAVVHSLESSAFRGYFSDGISITRGLVWRPDGSIVAGNWDGQITGWARGTRERLFRVQAQQGIQRLALRPKSPDQVAIVGATHVTSLWSLGTAQASNILDDHQGIVLAASDVSWCSSGERLASSAGRDVIAVLDSGTDIRQQRLQDKEWGYVNSIAWSHDCRRLAIGAWRGLYIWNAETGVTSLVGRHMGDAVNASQLEAEGVLRVDWSPNDAFLASGGQDRTVRIWATDTTREPEVLSGHSGPVYDVTWSAEGKLATASGDGTVRIWAKEPYSDLFKAQIINTGQGPVFSVAWSPDGTEVASGGQYGGVRIWRATSGGEAVALSSHRGTLTFADDEPLFDGMRLSDAQLLELARLRSARGFTNGECERFFNGSCP